MSGLVHQALVYDGVEEFVEGTLPFVLDGLEAGEVVFAAAGARNVEALRAALGDAAGEVDFRDAEEWYATPPRTLLAYARYVEGHAGRRVRVVGEPVWAGRSDAAVREWTRYESILNAVFADADAWILCPYDAGALDRHVVALAHATHPEVASGGRRARSSAYLAPRALCARLDADALDEPPPGAVSLPLSAGLTALRTFAREHARAAELSGERLGWVELAVHEVLANALVHAGGRGALYAWTRPDELVYEVADEGDGVADPLAGHLPPDPDRTGGFGLWIARQLADLVEVRSGAGGTRVRLHFDRAV